VVELNGAVAHAMRPVRRKDCVASLTWKHVANFPVITFCRQHKPICCVAPATLPRRERLISARLRFATQPLERRYLERRLHELET